MTQRDKPPSGKRREVVLVGGGHAHVQILRRWMMRGVKGSGEPDTRLVVVLDRPVAVYSGMVPARVAGEIGPQELEIDVLPLARRAGAAVVLEAATAIDPKRRRIEFASRPSIPFDIASLDVGSCVRGLDTPGVAEFALATRPIGRFVAALDAKMQQWKGGQTGPRPALLRVAVVGAGAAGVELALTLDARLRRTGLEPHIQLVSSDADILAGTRNAALRRRAARELRERGVQVTAGRRVVEVGADWVDTLPSARPTGEPRREAADLVIWATGAAPPPLLGQSPLPLDAAGFVRSDRQLQVEGVPGLFAVGDCASFEHAPWVPKAGVHAVRQGPVLDRNLQAALRGEALTNYDPQRDFLALLNTGDGRAIGGKWGLAVAGRSMHRLKDWIDRRFMRRFQVLAEGASSTPEFSRAMPGMSEAEMVCGGCAAKLGASPLDRALRRSPAPLDDADVILGLAQPDDAAAFRVGAAEGTAPVVLITVDGFRAFTDDPYLVGRVAAQNALSDVYAKGGRPRHALAQVGVHEADPVRAEEELVQVLAGVRAALDPLGVTLLGGHTTTGEDLSVALCVTGELAPGEEPIRLSGASPGDALLLSKGLGTGVLFAADMRGRARGPWIVAALAAMQRSNANAARVARDAGATACTDVSGFGLAGHLAELCRASHVSAELKLDAVPTLPGALEALAAGLRSSAHANNAEGRRSIGGAAGLESDPRLEVLFDPQTSGGLLFSVEGGRAAEALDRLRAGGDAAASIIGQVRTPRSDDAPFVVRGQPPQDHSLASPQRSDPRRSPSA